MATPKISVVVPVYNTGAYLRRCVDSVLSQTVSDYEIILINDGSTDDSGTVCEAIADAHNCIVTVHQPNGGLAAARNTGLLHARGEYVLFLDSDDVYLRDDAFEKLLAAASTHAADVVCFDYVRVNAAGTHAPVSAGKSADITGAKSAAVPRMLWENLYTSSACLKLISHTLLADNALRFPLDVRSEDVPFSLRLLQLAQKPIFLAQALYGYTVRDGSITNSIDARVVTDTLRLLRAMRLCVQEDDPLREHYLAYVAFQYCTLLVNACLARPATTQEAWRDIAAQRDLLRYDGNKIVRMVRMCASVCGIRLTARLLCLYVKGKG